MLRIVIGVFMVLHGLIYMLYFGQSWGLFELQPGLLWPDSSWAFSMLGLGNNTIRLLTSISCVLTAIGFVVGGIAILARQTWWRSAIIGVALFSSIIFILLWNGKIQRLDDQGGVGLLINIAILAAMFLIKWSDFEF